MTVEEWDFGRRLRKISIIGNGGGRKSTLARHLGHVLELPVYSIDDYQFQPGWRRTPAEEMSNAHETWLSNSGWIIDGWGSWDLIEKRFEKADLIVFVDFPLKLHYRWALKRQVQAMLGLSKDWPPPGCRALPITWLLMKTLWRVNRDYLPRLMRLTSEEPLRSRVVELYSPGDLQALRKRLTV